jgi:transcriptional regulator with XRE-family HTH domain
MVMSTGQLGSIISKETGLGQRLKEVRLQRKLSRVNLSLLMGLKKSSAYTVYLIENGDRDIGTTSLFKFCKALEIKPSELLASIGL